jgi:hypothetical protein
MRKYYLADPAHHPYAGDPNSNSDPRNHMRGAAWDARDTDAETQAACREAGAIRDPSEPWHWNDPNASAMPIIPVNIISASDNHNPLPPILKIRKLENVFSFIRNPANGEITLLDYSDLTRKPLSGPQWTSLAANGNNYSNAKTAAEYAQVVNGFALKK